jgi:hypothetical protein
MTNSGAGGELADLGPRLQQYVEASLPARVDLYASCASCGARFRLPRGPRSRFCPGCRPEARERSEMDRARRRAILPTPGKRVCDGCGRPYRASRSGRNTARRRARSEPIGSAGPLNRSWGHARANLCSQYTHPPPDAVFDYGLTPEGIENGRSWSGTIIAGRRRFASVASSRAISVGFRLEQACGRL